MKRKNKKIIFRVTYEMYDFIKTFSNKLGIKPSELLRLVIVQYFMSYFTQNSNFEYEKTKEKFLKMYGESINSVNSEYDSKQ